jgi:hypothetical protein
MIEFLESTTAIVAALAVIAATAKFVFLGGDLSSAAASSFTSSTRAMKRSPSIGSKRRRAF